MAKKFEARYECIAYLSVEADLDKVDRLEDKQLKYIKEYAKAHNILIVGIMRRHGFSMNDVFRNFKQIASLMKAIEELNQDFDILQSYVRYKIPGEIVENSSED